jgi:hypothetical protein
MDVQLDRHFTHYAQYRILVCNICRYAIWPQGVRRHLDDKHRGVPVDTRAALQRTVEQVQPLAQTEDDIIFPTSIIAPIPHLHLHTSASKCLHEGCSYICETTDHMITHAKDQHN